MAYGRIDLHCVHTHGAIAVQHQDLLVGLGYLRAETIGETHPHRAGDAGVQAMAGH